MGERDRWGVRAVVVLGPRVTGTCRWCGGPVGRPRLYWCGDACVAEIDRRRWNKIVPAITKRDGACRLCSTPYPSALQWEVDHILPVADGGNDHPDNLRLLCVPCHKGVTAKWRKDRASRPAPATP